MQKKITLVRHALLLLCLGIVAGSMVLHRGPSPFLSQGDPTQLTRPELAGGQMGRWADGQLATAVKVTTPSGTKWVYKDFSQGTTVAEFLNDMGEELFGKQAYAMGAPQMAERNRASDALGTEVGRHRKLDERAEARAPNTVHLVARHPDGTVFYDQTFHNLRTNAGINWQYGQMAGSTAAVCTYIALSNSGATPAATDTALASEITTNGLARANGTASHSANATSYTISYTFTATGAQAAQNAGILNASSSGTLCFENTFSQVSMQSGDTLAVTWTVNF